MELHRRREKRGTIENGRGRHRGALDNSNNNKQQEGAMAVAARTSRVAIQRCDWHRTGPPRGAPAAVGPSSGLK